MRHFFARIGESLRRFMVGRYGGDTLNSLLLTVSTVLLLLSFIRALWFLFIPAYAVMIWALFRCLSRNIYRRRGEEAKFLRLTGNFKKRHALRRKKWNERKTHRYYKCPACRATLRVPKPQNRIILTCPRCGKKIEKGPRKLKK